MKEYSTTVHWTFVCSKYTYIVVKESLSSRWKKNQTCLHAVQWKARANRQKIEMGTKFQIENSETEITAHIDLYQVI